MPFYHLISLPEASSLHLHKYFGGLYQLRSHKHRHDLQILLQQSKRTGALLKGVKEQLLVEVGMEGEGAAE